MSDDDSPTEDEAQTLTEWRGDDLAERRARREQTTAPPSLILNLSDEDRARIDALYKVLAPTPAEDSKVGQGEDIAEECEAWLAALGRPRDGMDVWTNGARAFADHLAGVKTGGNCCPLCFQRAEATPQPVGDEGAVEALARVLYGLVWEADLYATPRNTETERYESRARRLLVVLDRVPGVTWTP